MRRPEQQLHIAVARYLALMLPHDAFFCHVPNGGKRSLTEAGIFKAMGVKAGVPDILIAYQGRAFWIELKAAAGKISESQAEAAKQLAAAGCQVVVCRSIDELQIALASWRIPTRMARVA